MPTPINMFPGKTPTVKDAAYIAELEALFLEMAEHLDYCGYGDKWERECAYDAKLPDRVQAMQEKINE